MLKLVCKGFGESGLDSQRGGYDVVAASMGGLLHVTGDPAGPPTKVKVNGIKKGNILEQRWVWP